MPTHLGLALLFLMVMTTTPVRAEEGGSAVNLNDLYGAPALPSAQSAQPDTFVEPKETMDSLWERPTSTDTAKRTAIPGDTAQKPAGSEKFDQLKTERARQIPLRSSTTRPGLNTNDPLMRQKMQQVGR